MTPEKKFEKMKMMLEVMGRGLEEMRIKRDITDKMLEPAEGEEVIKSSTSARVKNQSDSIPKQSPG